jgi:hypothetical protein
VTRHSDAFSTEPGEDESPRPMPTRPPAVELAGAILIVGGVVGLIGLVTAAPGLPAFTLGLLLLTLALNVAPIAIGVLVRMGRAWIVDVNYVAVIAFLDLLSIGSSPLGLIFGVANVLVVIILIRHKPWFDEMSRWRADERDRLNP